VVREYGLDGHSVGARVTLVTVPDEQDPALAVETSKYGVRELELTRAFDQVVDAAAGHDLVIVDGVTDAFAASENSRPLVRRFLRAMRGIARKQTCAVLLLGHIDKAAARANKRVRDQYSGSTDWHNAVRSRLELVVEDGCIELLQPKASRGAPIEHQIVFRRGPSGVPIPVSERERQRSREEDMQMVLAAIKGCVQEGVIVPTAISGPRTVVHVLSVREELSPVLAKDRHRIRDTVTELERQKKIRRTRYQDKSRHWKRTYSLCDPE
jgi:hypothetical protein